MSMHLFKLFNAIILKYLHKYVYHWSDFEKRQQVKTSHNEIISDDFDINDMETCWYLLNLVIGLFTAQTPAWQVKVQKFPLNHRVAEQGNTRVISIDEK